MARGTGTQQAEVTFISHDAQIAIRLICNNTSAICNAASKLKARYFVAVDGWHDMQDCPIWGVFDMHTADKNNPHPGAWSVRDPVRTFVAETSDAAVMYALAMLGRKS